MQSRTFRLLQWRLVFLQASLFFIIVIVIAIINTLSKPEVKTFLILIYLMIYYN